MTARAGQEGRADDEHDPDAHETVPDQCSVDLADLEAGTRFVSSESDGPGIVEFQKRLAMRRAAS